MMGASKCTHELGALEGDLDRHAHENMHMRKVAVFGNAGGGKSTLARQLAELTVSLSPMRHLPSEFTI